MIKKQRSKILIIDDNYSNREILKVLLEPDNYIIHSVNSGANALSVLEKEDIDLILLDIMMPKMDGFEFCKIVKLNKKTHDIPIIFQTVIRNANTLQKAFNAGAVDYINKPYEEVELRARVKTHIALKQSRVQLLAELQERKKAEKKITEMNKNLEHLVIKRTKALKKSEQNFKDLFNKSNESIILNTFAGKIIDVNDKMCKMLGYSKKEFLNMTVFDIMLDKYTKKRSSVLSKIREKRMYIFESENITKLGKIIPVEISSVLFNYYNQEIILSSARNITERREIQKKIYNTVIETEEKERNRFAKDIHDGLGATISAVKMYLNIIKRTELNSKKAKQMLNQAVQLLDTAGKNAKEIAVNILPHDLAHFGLKVSLGNFCKKINQIGTVNIKLNMKTYDANPDKEIELIVFRTINELINNTIKYAYAKNINIVLNSNISQLILTYSDDGKGFDYEKTMNNKRSGIGLDNIINRTKMTGGNVKIHSKPGDGMRAKIVFEI